MFGPVLFSRKTFCLVPERPPTRGIRTPGFNMFFSTTGHFHFLLAMHLHLSSLSSVHPVPADLLALQIRPEGNCVIVLAIVRAVDQRHSSLTRCRQERPPDLFVCVQVPKVTSLEFFPSRRIVMEPFSKSSTGRHFLRPLLQLSRGLRHSARPQTFHENTLAVIWSCGFIDALQNNHALLRPRCSCCLNGIWRLSVSIFLGALRHERHARSHRKLQCEPMATPFAQPEVDDGTSRFLLTDRGRNIFAGFLGIPDFIRKELPFLGMEKLSIAIGISTLCDHGSLRLRDGPFLLS